MIDWREDLLTAILDCGYGDLYLLSNCQYDIGEIVEECETMNGNLNINNLARIMFDFGLRDIEKTIDERICELEAVKNERELDENELQELVALRGLSPFNDMKSFHNFIDTHIWIYDEDKKTDYTTYLSEALDHFYEMTGFEITC